MIRAWWDGVPQMSNEHYYDADMSYEECIDTYYANHRDLVAGYKAHWHQEHSCPASVAADSMRQDMRLTERVLLKYFEHHLGLSPAYWVASCGKWWIMDGRGEQLGQGGWAQPGEPNHHHRVFVDDLPGPRFSGDRNWRSLTIGTNRVGEMSMVGGELNIIEDLVIAASAAAEGTFTMTGGYIELEGNLVITQGDGGRGTLEFYGGVVHGGNNSDLLMNGYETQEDKARMDFVEGGTLDLYDPNGADESRINTYLGQGKITAYGLGDGDDGFGTVAIIHVVRDHPRVMVTAEYDVTQVITKTWAPHSPPNDYLWSDIHNWHNPNPSRPCGVPNMANRALVDDSPGPIIDSGTDALTGGDLIIGDHVGAELTIDGGTLSVHQDLVLGYSEGIHGVFTINDGDVTVTRAFHVSHRGSAMVHLDGGTVRCNSEFFMNEGSAMDITEGRLIIDRDKESEFNQWIEDGRITAYGIGYGEPGWGTTHQVIVTSNGHRTWVSADFVPSKRWDNGAPDDNFWHSPANWQPDGVPTNESRVIIDELPPSECLRPLGTPGAKMLDESCPSHVVIEPGRNAIVGHDLVVGEDHTAKLTMSGSRLQVDRDLILGEVAAISDAGGGNGELEVNSGRVTVAGSLLVPGGGMGALSLGDATIQSNGFQMRLGGAVDITTGTLMVFGDHEWEIQEYVDNGWITAYGHGAGDSDFGPGEIYNIMVAYDGKHGHAQKEVLWTRVTATLNPKVLHWDAGGSNDLWANPLNWDFDLVPDNRVKAVIDRLPAAVIDPLTDALVGKSLIVGDHSDAVLEMTGGYLRVVDNFVLGYCEGNEGTFNMSGGSVWINSGLFVPHNGEAVVHLDGGDISCQAFWMENESLIDITNGELRVHDPSGSAAARIADYIEDGWITAFGGSGRVTMSFESDWTVLRATRDVIP